MDTVKNINPSVSVIIPVYNQQKYLKQCIKSVIKQSLKNIEIIVVNDGSTDKSQKLITKIAKKDKRIVVINKKNTGYGNTMNVGIDCAKGDYIGIVESDDFVDTNMFKELYDVAIKSEADIVKSDYFEFKAAKRLFRKYDSTYVRSVTDNKYYELMNIKSNPNLLSYAMNTWTGIYKKTFLKQNSICHNETPGAAYQDNGFWFQTLSLAQKIVYIDKPYYWYRQDNPNSSINSTAKVFCMCDEYGYIKKFIDQHPNIKEYCIKDFYRKKFFNYLFTYKRLSDSNKLIFLKRMSKEFNDDLSNGSIKMSYFDEWTSSMISRIVADYECFYYEDKIYNLKIEIASLERKIENAKNSPYFKKGDRLLKPIRKFLGRK